MYKKISYSEKVTRQINEMHSADNYLTKDTTESLSVSVNKLNGKLDPSVLKYERVYYFINADVNFLIDGEEVHCSNGDVLYLSENTTYSAEGTFEAVTINVPAYGCINKQ